MPKKYLPSEGKLPKTYLSFTQKYPALAAAHTQIGRVVDQLGPLDRKTCELIKIGISLGAALESATKSHVRRALEYGALPEEVEQAVLLGMNTRGFPATVAAWQWAQTQISAIRPAPKRATSSKKR